MRNERELQCGAVGCTGFVFHFLQLSSDCAGLNRQDARSDTAVGPKENRFTVPTRQSMVSNKSESINVRSGHQNTELQCTRMAIAPNVDRKHRHHTSHINVRYNVNKYNSIIPSRLPILASSFQAGSSKYCRASRAQKLLYLNQNDSESSDSSCIGFPVGPTITRKLGLSNFDRFKIHLHNMQRARRQHRVAWTTWEAFTDAIARAFELATVVEEAH